jgi:hypothetical protein
MHNCLHDCKALLLMNLLCEQAHYSPGRVNWQATFYHLFKSGNSISAGASCMSTCQPIIKG